MFLQNLINGLIVILLQLLDYLQLLLKLKVFIMLELLLLNLIVTGVGTTAVAIGTDGATGIVTHIDVRGDLSKLQSNDILGIGTETLKLLNVEPLLSRIRVLRAANGVTGVSHTVTSEILEDPRRLTINSGFTSDL